MAGGTQNRNSKIALESHLFYKDKTKECGCPIHRVDNKKTEISALLFNRDGDSGLQGMCRLGKSLLDSFKHKMNSWKIIFIYDKITNSDLLLTLKKGFKCNRTNMFYESCVSIFEDTYNTILSENDLSIRYFKFMSIIDNIIGGKNGNVSLLNRIGIYTSNLSEEDFKSIITDSDPSNGILTEDQIKSCLKLQDIFCDQHNLYVKESSTGEILHHSNFNTGLGKIREVYNEDGSLFKIDGEDLRLNKFNTCVKGKSDSRVERYFTDGDYKIANKRMIEINKSGMSADHIWPISLGGKHDPSNLEPMKLSDNIKKRNSLSIDLINRVKENPSDFISSRYLNIFNDICNDNITIEKVIELERRLKLSIDEWTNNIRNMSESKKREHIISMLTEHNIGITKCDKIIKEYYTK
jgi:hypothetical protein